ncbi:hypothetical protein GCM10008927_10470 [Amylibacter ulvae]|uniref:N-acetyltransferase domain-containing protein n=1 Tax=Paramylibacter ulvae TaxID=1651968 RepID=A0ABQ3CWN0_9RHOB|nr:GNAT family N-acetyltransferase [Amylibacter ulvae]GHA47568.1 hypothetical protein GCM10008927_10470 [Amylibacter ulvae]
MQIGTAAELGVSPEQVQNFYRDVWSRPIALSDPNFYAWQFINSPRDMGLDSCVIAFDEKIGQVAGAMGVTPRNFNLGQTTLRGGELTTWATGEAYRNKGAGAKILKHIMDNFDILIGMGITNDALPIYLRSGFKYVREIPRFVKVLDFEKIEAFCETDAMGMRLAKKWSGVSSKNYDVSVATPDDIESAYAQMTKQYNLFARDSVNMAWRYDAHPNFKYMQFCVRPIGSKHKSIVAVRFHQTDQGFTVLHIMDVFGDQSAIGPARCFIENFGAENGAHVIDFYCTSSAIYAEFVANNWFSTTNDPQFCFPHLFSPLELRHPQTTSLIYWAKDHLVDMADISKLYITKQDADLDRPVPATAT